MGFGWKSLEHFFTASAQDIVKAARTITNVASKIEDPKVQATIEGATALFYPPAKPLEDAAFALLGKVAATAKGAGSAAAQNGLSLTLDAAFVADVQGLIPQIEAFAAGQGQKPPAK